VGGREPARSGLDEGYDILEGENEMSDQIPCPFCKGVPGKTDCIVCNGAGFATPEPSEPESSPVSFAVEYEEEEQSPLEITTGKRVERWRSGRDVTRVSIKVHRAEMTRLVQAYVIAKAKRAGIAIPDLNDHEGCDPTIEFFDLTRDGDHHEQIFLTKATVDFYVNTADVSTLQKSEKAGN
jgi:hypothetical protein